jgi:hypothetical protein
LCADASKKAETQAGFDLLQIRIANAELNSYRMRFKLDSKAYVKRSSLFAYFSPEQFSILQNN